MRGERSMFIQTNFVANVNSERVDYLRSSQNNVIPESLLAQNISIRAWLREFYSKEITQMIVSVIIILNGVMYVIQTSKWSETCCVDNEDAQNIFDSVDFCFLLLYTVELSFNFYAHFFWEFWRKTKWNWFDAVVILASWFPWENLAVIRLLRTLRLTRVSGRVKSFTFVVETLQKSIAGIGTLMAMLVGFVTIYAVLGVGLFSENSDQFEDFFTATWTLFITLNGESWPDFAEPLIDEYWYTKLYFGTFIITVSVVILNMIIAVFIEKTAEVWYRKREKVSGNNIVEDAGPRIKPNIRLSSGGNKTKYD